MQKMSMSATDLCILKANIHVLRNLNFDQLRSSLVHINLPFYHSHLVTFHVNHLHLVNMALYFQELDMLPEWFYPIHIELFDVIMTAFPTSLFLVMF